MTELDKNEHFQRGYRAGMDWPESIESVITRLSGGKCKINAGVGFSGVTCENEKELERLRESVRGYVEGKRDTLAEFNRMLTRHVNEEGGYWLDF